MHFLETLHKKTVAVPLRSITSRTKFNDLHTKFNSTTAGIPPRIICIAQMPKSCTIVHVLTSKKSYDEKSQQKVIDIIKALNMKLGHWFKCPNGHLYLIGECGGGMETAKCNECVAVIGGANHALLGTNRFAPEMDGAVRPAYGAVLAPQNFGF